MLECIWFHGTLNLAMEVKSNDSVKVRVYHAESAWCHQRYLLITYHFCRVHLDKSNIPQLVTKFFPIFLTKSSLEHLNFPQPSLYSETSIHYIYLFHFLNCLCVVWFGVLYIIKSYHTLNFKNHSSPHACRNTLTQSHTRHTI